MSAGLLLLAVPLLADHGLPHPTAAQVLEKTGASRSRAYELRAAIAALLPMLLRRPGRPVAAPPPPKDTSALSQAVIAHIMNHPGAVTGSSTRRCYSEGFRHCVLELADQHPDLDLAALAKAVGVPAPTIQDWLATPRTPPPTPPSATETDDRAEPTSARIASILVAWRRWRGGFSAFCGFVRTALVIPYGDTLIGRILEMHAGRRPKRRPGRSPDDKALRSALLTFFPGAQWFADGSSITLTLNDQTFRFNWELVVDSSSGAFVGSSVRAEEDGRAVAEAFEDGVATTGAHPQALTTDNRAANHTSEVAAALGDTIHIRATRRRPQNDAPVEGGFGLFQQTAPPLVVQGATDQDLARSILTLCLTIWGRAVNHRPRSDRGGRTREQLYRGEKPTDAQIAAARAALEERRRRQELAFATRQARLNPLVRALLDEAFARLGLEDPTGNVKDAIARYPHDAVLAGIATFDGKRTAGTLPPDVGPRYLLGIVRQITQRDEGVAIAEALWQARLAARDRALVQLNQLRQATPGAPNERIWAFVDRALAADGPLLRSYWLHAVADEIAAKPPFQTKPLYDTAVRRIHATFRVAPRERQAAVRYLAAKLLPVA